MRLRVNYIFITRRFYFPISRDVIDINILNIQLANLSSAEKYYFCKKFRDA